MIYNLTHWLRNCERCYEMAYSFFRLAENWAHHYFFITAHIMFSPHNVSKRYLCSSWDLAPSLLKDICKWIRIKRVWFQCISNRTGVPIPILTLNMMNCFKQKIYSYFESYLRFGSTQVDEIKSGTTIHVACATELIPCLLMRSQL